MGKELKSSSGLVAIVMGSIRYSNPGDKNFTTELFVASTLVSMF